MAASTSDAVHPPPGWVRSGKTAVAERAARRTGLPVTYVATARPGDEEMTARIVRHRAHRPFTWTTVEEPVDIRGAIASVDDRGFIVVDCLTLWLSSRLDDHDRDVLGDPRIAASALAARQGPAVVVSNGLLLADAWALLPAVVAAGLMVAWSSSNIGGVTGDVLGAVQQVSMLALLVSMTV